MTFSTLIDAIADRFRQAARHAGDGYFGWTDRYGMRKAYVRHADETRAAKRPRFTANY